MMSNFRKNNLFEKLLDSLEYNKFHYKYLFITFLLMGIDGLIMTFFSCLIIPLTKYYNLSILEQVISSSIIFLAVAISNLYLKYLINTYGRIKTLNIGLFLIIISFFGFIIQNVYFFILFRFLIGIGNGIQLSIILIISTENIPSKGKSYHLAICWMGFGVYQLFILVLMLIYCPEFDIDNIKPLLFYISLISLITCMIVNYLIEDSILNLILNRNFDKAKVLLNQMLSESNMIISDKEYSNIINSVLSDNTEDSLNDIIIYDDNINTDLKEKLIIKRSFYYDLNILFNKEYKKSTLLISIICITCAMIFYGPLLITTVVNKELNSTSEINISNRNIIVENIYIAIMITLSNIICGFLTGIKLKTKYILSLLYTGCLISNILILIMPRYYNIFQLLVLILGNMSYNLFIIYFTDLYPIHLKNSSTSLFFLINRFGAFLSQILFLCLFYIGGVLFPYYLLLIILSVTIITTLCFPL